MPRAREQRIARLAARANAGDDDAAWRRATLRARAAVGAVLRRALAQAGVDPATVAMMRLVDEADRELAAVVDAPEPAGDDDDAAATLWARIDRLAQRGRDQPAVDFAQISLAEALASCLARLAGLPPGEIDGPAARC